MKMYIAAIVMAVFFFGATANALGFFNEPIPPLAKKVFVEQGDTLEAIAKKNTPKGADWKEAAHAIRNAPENKKAFNEKGQLLMNERLMVPVK